ncbi:MAG: hypothetical protein A3F67_02940 [Verrucomicrobia bacterium RIFCSPHIGHO2_12_FULL_41_10]|nr:MAG: hypothetical protein A3F67_02940 [Verrucomicrobia bacterium RIFCSPHIGHO2_12_FULL_41_10]
MPAQFLICFLERQKTNQKLELMYHSIENQCCISLLNQITLKIADHRQTPLDVRLSERNIERVETSNVLQMPA